MRVLDLFSGIGGFSLGLERAGMETVAFCEIEEYPRKILAKHWPAVPIFNDIKKLKGDEIGETDVICGGFPCQPFSVAGHKKGTGDDRHLWPEMFRLIREKRPRWVIGENVAGFVSMALDSTILDLENEGYEVQSFVIPACAVQAIHRRDRVWIIAHSKSSWSVKPPTPQPSIRQGDEFREENISDVNTATQSVTWNEFTSKEKYREPERKTGRRDSKIYEGFRSVQPPTQSPVRDRNDGLPDNVARLKALGNSVVPQIPELIGRYIIEVEKTYHP